LQLQSLTFGGEKQPSPSCWSLAVYSYY